MCMIINNIDGKKLDTEIIVDILSANPDGVGFYDLNTGKLRKTMDYNTAYQWLESETPFVAHCRFATKGEVCKKNIHPFKFGDHLLMMNGTIDGYVDGNDTRQLVKQLRYVKPENVLEFLAFFKARFCVINTKTNEVQTVGKWIDREGVQFSNDRPFQNKVILDSPIIAVYGTLKFGHDNHDSYLANSHFIDYGMTSDTYRLCVEGLPYLLRGVDHERGDFIDVEVYSITNEVLEALDGLEGHPHFYRRELVEIELDSGGSVQAIVYMVGDEYDTGEYVSCYDNSYLDNNGQGWPENELYTIDSNFQLGGDDEYVRYKQHYHI